MYIYTYTHIYIYNIPYAAHVWDMYQQLHFLKCWFWNWFSFVKLVQKGKESSRQFKSSWSKIKMLLTWDGVEFFSCSLEQCARPRPLDGSWYHHHFVVVQLCISKAECLANALWKTLHGWYLYCNQGWLRIVFLSFAHWFHVFVAGIVGVRVLFVFWALHSVSN